MLTDEKVIVLAILPVDREFHELNRLFAHSNWALHRVQTRLQALRYLQRHQPSVVLSAPQLPDAGWKEVLSDLERLPNCPKLIVIAPEGKPVSPEALRTGVFDVLEAPVDSRELFSSLSFAWHQVHSSHMIARPVGA